MLPDASDAIEKRAASAPVAAAKSAKRPAVNAVRVAEPFAPATLAKSSSRRRLRDATRREASSAGGATHTEALEALRPAAKPDQHCVHVSPV